MRPAVSAFGCLVFCAAAAASLLWPAPFANARQSSPGRNEVSGISKASEERKLSFSNPGVVQYSPAKEGDVVKQDQPILGLEDEIEKKELARLQLEANSNARIEAAEADLRVKEAILKRKTEANDQARQNGGGEAYNVTEMEEAANDVTLREKQVQVAKEEQQQAKIKAEQQTTRVGKLMIKSPIDGIVEKIVVHVGEWADPQSRDGAIMVVKNDPVYVEVRELKSRQVAMLKLGQKLKVRYADDGDKQENWQEAEIFYFASVADPMADTRLFKLRLANPTGRPSGLWMVVQIPEEVAAAADAAPANVAAGK